MRAGTRRSPPDAAGTLVRHMVEKAFPTRVVTGLVLAIVLIGGVVVAGSVLREDDQSGASGPEPTTTTASTAPTTTTTTLPALQQPAPAPDLPAAPLYGSIGPGSDPAVVAAFQQRLHDLKFDPGPVDGNYGQAMI